MRRAARIDDNQVSVVKALRKAGCKVLSLAAVGDGCPDLLVYRPATESLHLIEVKDGEKFPSQQKLTPKQVEFHDEWPVNVSKDIDEALEAVGI
jgi:Holliday junction resolvase